VGDDGVLLGAEQREEDDLLDPRRFGGIYEGVQRLLRVDDGGRAHQEESIHPRERRGKGRPVGEVERHILDALPRARRRLRQIAHRTPDDHILPLEQVDHLCPDSARGPRHQYPLHSNIPFSALP